MRTAYPISIRVTRKLNHFLSMKPTFWIRRFLLVFFGAFVVLATAGFVRGRPWETVLADSGLWGAIAATLFVATRLYHSRKGRHCALCRDTPETYYGDANTLGE
jgi:hypothetical protein